MPGGTTLRVYLNIKKYKQRYAFHAAAKINNLMPRASKI